MKAKQYLLESLQNFIQQKKLEWPIKTTIGEPTSKNFGDMSTNLALVLAKELGQNPRILAEEIKNFLTIENSALEKIEIAGPGFLNFTFTNTFWISVLTDIETEGDNYGRGKIVHDEIIQIEYVSANPTGPLHIGHGRGAALGDSLARILRFAGYNVKTEYYINDAGRQMLILGTSVFVRYQQALGKNVELPENSYKGEYIHDIAKQAIIEKYGDSLLSKPETQAIEICGAEATEIILNGIKRDLKMFRVEHEEWFSEKKLLDKGAVDAAFSFLREKGFVYDKDGAIWFASTIFGDDKDRVLRKSDGSLTYFASDIAYHANKIERGITTMIDVWGADHHGYIPRMKAAIQALGKSGESLKISLVQLANLVRDGKQVAMSTRSGEFETLADVCAEVGVDATRFIFLSRKSDSHLDFDLEIVKRSTLDNPVYYVQYAHARIQTLLARAKTEKIFDLEVSTSTYKELTTREDIDILQKLDMFPDIVEMSVNAISPHYIAYYLQELAGLLHRYYNVHSVLSATDVQTVGARIGLLRCVAQVLRLGLALLGVNAPNRM